LINDLSDFGQKKALVVPGLWVVWRPYSFTAKGSWAIFGRDFKIGNEVGSIVDDRVLILIQILVILPEGSFLL